MRIETIEIYTFNELSEQTKAKVRDNFRNGGDLWAWGEDYWQSAREFSRISPIDIREADYTYARVEARWTGEDSIAELSGLRAWKWLLNNGWFAWAEKNAQGDCTMTGFNGDCPFADAFIEYKNNPLKTPSVLQVFREAAQSWVYEAQRDMEHAYTNEAIDDLIECNEYEFYSNGCMA